MKVSLFITCLGDVFNADTGVHTVELLERLGCEIDFPRAQTCCGQPAFNSGYHKEAAEAAKHMIEAFEHAEYVVGISGSCVYMVHEYEGLFEEGSEWQIRARALKEKTYELTEFIVDVLGIEDVGAEYNGVATYHTSCHMTRLLGVKEAPFKLLRNVKGLQLIDLPNRSDCCGFGGTFAVKMNDISEQMVDEKVNHIKETEADTLIGADGSCLMNIGGRLSRREVPVKVMHIAEILNARGE
ncbi:L-lactate dehydrogenase complex protein LldE [Gracilibacillus halotolerans]|uniref:Lactate utilization protein A n=1 Tax=Gracilibacillus halotolerans TaxID=74386 RepID=A0A841RIU1_9BACI|nr:(Fe-S)-binding protein [Gracilibacillus halotolerans]MBB6511573.1 L-lactate dehydrogenase complex protein LldE [Gracilibacillus halotolerans]